MALRLMCSLRASPSSTQLLDHQLASSVIQQIYCWKHLSWIFQGGSGSILFLLFSLCRHLQVTSFSKSLFTSHDLTCTEDFDACWRISNLTDQLKTASVADTSFLPTFHLTLRICHPLPNSISFDHVSTTFMEPWAHLFVTFAHTTFEFYDSACRSWSWII